MNNVDTPFIIGTDITKKSYLFKDITLVRPCSVNPGLWESISLRTPQTSLGYTHHNAYINGILCNVLNLMENDFLYEDIQFNKSTYNQCKDSISYAIKLQKDEIETLTKYLTCDISNLGNFQLNNGLIKLLDFSKVKFPNEPKKLPSNFSADITIQIMEPNLELLTK